MELFTNLEIMIMVSVVGFLLFVILLLTILEIFSKKKDNKEVSPTIEVENTEEKKENVSIELSKTEDNAVKNRELIVDDANNSLDDEITLEMLEDDIRALTSEKKLEIQEKAKEEVKPMIEQLEEIEPTNETSKVEEEIEILEIEPEIEPDSSKKAYLELEKIKEELEDPVSLEATITNLEAQEEESAIISYQELLSVTGEMPVITEEDMGDEPISITEVYEKFTGEKMESPSINDIYEASLKTGVETENINEIQLENTANLEKLDKEIRKTNKVLNMLNELKKNLD